MRFRRFGVTQKSGRGQTWCHAPPTGHSSKARNELYNKQFIWRLVFTVHLILCIGASGLSTHSSQEHRQSGDKVNLSNKLSNNIKHKNFRIKTPPISSSADQCKIKIVTKALFAKEIKIRSKLKKPFYIMIIYLRHGKLFRG